MTNEETSKQTEWLIMMKKIMEYRKKGFTWPKIADAMGTTVASIQSHWYRRRHLLQDPKVREETKNAEPSEETAKNDANSKPQEEAACADESGKSYDDGSKQPDESLPDLLEACDNEYDTQIDDTKETLETNRQQYTEEKKQECITPVTKQNGPVHTIHSMEQLRALVETYDVHYLVDTENVNSIAIANLAKGLQDNAVMILFYSENSNNLPYEVLEMVLQHKGNVSLEYCECGTKNAMDFKITTVLGYMMSTCDPKKNAFTIISSDTGYDVVIRYWKQMGMPVARIAAANLPMDLMRMVNQDFEDRRRMFFKAEADNLVKPVNDQVVSRVPMCRSLSVPLKTQESNDTMDLGASQDEKKPEKRHDDAFIKPEKRQEDEISKHFRSLNPSQREKWVQIMSSNYGSLCKRYKIKSTDCRENSRILLEHPDFNLADFPAKEAELLKKIPATAIEEIRKQTYNTCIKKSK